MAYLTGNPHVEEINVRGVSPPSIDDPGDTGTIDTSRSAFCELTTAGAETRTLGDPAFKGQLFDLTFVTNGGDCVVTTSSPTNQTGNNTDGVVLSTV